MSRSDSGGRAVNLKDVAARAGVGVGTASRALSGTGYVAAVTLGQVQLAARELGYRPNNIAKALRTARSTTLALLLPDLVNEFYSVSSQVLQQEFSRAGYQLLVATATDGVEEAEVLDSLLEQRVAGLVHVPVDPTATVPAGMPVVQLNRCSQPAQVPAYLCGDEDGFDDLTSMLLERGYRDLALVVGGEQHSTTVDRIAGYRRAVARAETPEVPTAGRCDDGGRRSRVLAGQYDADWGSKALSSLLADLPEVLIAASPRLAVGVVGACIREGVRVPEDLALASYDDPEWFSLWSPGMTTLVPPLADMARKAAHGLLALIESPTHRREVTLTRVPGRISLRGSTPVLDTRRPNTAQ